MPDARYRVQVERDHLKKLASAKPIQALSELLWNAVDADATRVDVEIDADDMAMRAVTIRDNGHGIPHSDVEALFWKLGGSWKRHGSRSKSRGRLLHGKEGKGRLKALALGRSAVWSVRYRENDKLMSYSVSLLRDELVDVRVTEPVEVEPVLGTGVDVMITELDRTYRSLEPRRSVQALSEVFALYLTNYNDVNIYIENERLDPSALIAARKTINLGPIDVDDRKHPVVVDLIEWKAASERWFSSADRRVFHSSERRRAFIRLAINSRHIYGRPMWMSSNKAGRLTLPTWIRLCGTPATPRPNS